MRRSPTTDHPVNETKAKGLVCTETKKRTAESVTECCEPAKKAVQTGTGHLPGRSSQPANTARTLRITTERGMIRHKDHADDYVH